MKMIQKMKAETQKTSELTVDGDMVDLVVYLNPVPASRPRVTRWGTYYSKRYKEWMQAAANLIPGVPEVTEVYGGNLDVFVSCVVQKPKTTKRANPNGDIDNYAKAILDAVTKAGYWNDDDQIVKLTVVKRFTNKDESPFFGVHIEPYV